MSNVVGFEVEHYYAINHTERNVMLCQGAKFDPEVMFRFGHAVTIVVDEKPIAIMGFVSLAHGVCEVYTMPDKDVDKYRVAYAKEVKKYLIRLAQLPIYHRVQLIAIDDELHNRWCRFLGFVKEGTMLRYDELKRTFNMWRFEHGC